jgi:hypothetical protein
MSLKESTTKIRPIFWYKFACTNVADPGCLSQIRNFCIPDPGSKVKKIPDPDPHQRMEVFLTQQIVSKLSEIYPGCSSRIRIMIFYPSPDPGSSGEKTPDPGSATLKFYVKVADLTRSGSKTLNSNKN